MTDETPKPLVEETTEYDNFIGKVAKEYIPPTLNDMFDVSEEKEWEKHWVGMPEFDQDNNPPYKKLIVSFRTKEDYEAFAKIIDQNLTEKTKSIWHPKLEKTKNSLMRWIVDEE